MFENTFTFWRRLIGNAPAPANQTAAVEDDRRLWVRYAADLQGNVQLTENGNRDKFTANIRDLSLGGANLVVNRPLPAGQMLSLELPAAKNEVHTVLACVVHATEAEEGTWSLGCVFSRELTQDDLERFGAETVHSDLEDQRIWVRYDSALKADCRRFGEPASEARRVEVLNISASGIGLVFDSSVESGTLLSLDLLNKNARHVCTILACVVHTTLRSGDCALGCNFIRELSENELQSLL